jgi:hypothetical protein
MKNDVVPVEIRGILPANSGCAIFVGNEEKVFVIQVEHNMGAVIGMFLRDTPKERPLTHDLITSSRSMRGPAIAWPWPPLKNARFSSPPRSSTRSKICRNGLRKLTRTAANPSERPGMSVSRRTPLTGERGSHRAGQIAGAQLD